MSTPTAAGATSSGGTSSGASSSSMGANLDGTAAATHADATAAAAASGQMHKLSTLLPPQVTLPSYASVWGHTLAPPSAAKTATKAPATGPGGSISPATDAFATSKLLASTTATWDSTESAAEPRGLHRVQSPDQYQQSTQRQQQQQKPQTWTMSLAGMKPAIGSSGIASTRASAPLTLPPPLSQAPLPPASALLETHMAPTTLPPVATLTSLGPLSPVALGGTYRPLLLTLPTMAARPNKSGRAHTSSDHSSIRKKTQRACVFCQRSHLPCDSGRPCQRCIRRGIQDSCRDAERKKSKYLEGRQKPSDTLAPSSKPPGDPPTRVSPSARPPSDRIAMAAAALSASASSSIPTPHAVSANSFSSPSLPLGSGTSSAPTPNAASQPFVSDALNREFSVLGDIVTAPVNTSPQGVSAPMEMGIAAVQAPLQLAYNVELSSDSVYDRVTEPYSYAQGFHHLLSFTKQRMEKEDMLRICKALVSFRPPFIAAVANLSRQDLIFMEKCFQRMILEVHKLLTFVGTPTCVWRRTGELSLVGKEFSLLTQWAVEDLLSKSTFIYELMDNRSAVDYWEKYASVVLDNSQQSVVTKCNLIRPDRLVIPCTACYTIKRDIFDVPLCVVGNFLPILNTAKF